MLDLPILIAALKRIILLRSMLLLAACCGGLLLCSCAPKPAPPIRVGANLWPGHECLFLARSLGYLQGTPVKLVEYSSAPEMIRAFQNGALEAAAMTADEFLRVAEEESGVRAILVMDISQGADALLAHQDVQSLAELKGKRIGVELNAVGAYLLARVLESAGLHRREVEVVPLSNDRHEAAFVTGEADAVITFEPHRGKLLEHGARVLFDSREVPGELMNLLVVRKELIQNRGPELGELLRAWFKARTQLFEDPRRAAELIAPREGITPEAFLAALELIDVPSRERNLELLHPRGEELEDQLRRLRERMAAYGLIEGAGSEGRLLEGGLL